MKRLLLALAGPAVVGLLLAAPSPPPSAQELGDTQARSGQALFMTYCSSCHGKQGRGDGPVADALKTAPSDLTRIAERREGRFPAAEIAMFIDGRTLVISHGTREMPVWGQRFWEELGRDSVAEEITRGRIGVIIAYLRSIQLHAGSAQNPPKD